MEKSVKIILFIVLALVVISFLVTFFGNRNIEDIRKDLQRARLSADSALKEIRISQDKLDSIKSDMLAFSSYLNRIQDTVKMKDAEKTRREEKDTKKLNELKEIVKTRRDEIESFSLPAIDVISTNKNN